MFAASAIVDKHAGPIMRMTARQAGLCGSAGLDHLEVHDLAANHGIGMPT